MKDRSSFTRRTPAMRPRALAEIVVTGAQQHRDRECGVVDVVRVAPAVAVAVDTDDCPGRGREQHRPGRSVVAVVTIETAGVAVGDPLAVATAQRLAGELRPQHAVPVEPASVGGAVACDHLADRGHERPLEVTLLVGAAENTRGALVGGQGRARDPVELRSVGGDQCDVGDADGQLLDLHGRGRRQVDLPRGLPRRGLRRSGDRRSRRGESFERVTPAAVMVTEVRASADRVAVKTARRTALPVRTGSFRCRATMASPWFESKDATRSTLRIYKTSQFIR